MCDSKGSSVASGQNVLFCLFVLIVARENVQWSHCEQGGLRISWLSAACILRTCRLWLWLKEAPPRKVSTLCCRLWGTQGSGWLGAGARGASRVSPGRQGRVSLCQLVALAPSEVDLTHQGKPVQTNLLANSLSPGWGLWRPRPTENESSICSGRETADSFRLSLWGKRSWQMGRRGVPILAPGVCPTRDNLHVPVPVLSFL